MRIDADATNDPVTHLIGGRLDVAIVSDPVRDRRVVSRPIFNDEMVIVVDPRHPLASRPFVAPADLATETLVMYSSKEESTIYKLLAAEGIVPANTHVIQLTEAIVEMVKAGLGFAFLATVGSRAAGPRRHHPRDSRIRAAATAGRGAPPH